VSRVCSEGWGLCHDTDSRIMYFSLVLVGVLEVFDP
jgi:hypothetical protein